MKPYAFGIDIGGTTVKIGFFETTGTLLKKWEIPTRTEDGESQILTDIADAVKAELQERGLASDTIEGIGMGIPGPVLGEKVVNKPAAAVCVCRRGGATAAYQTMNMPFQMMNMPVVTSQYWNIVYGREEGQAALDTEGMQTMRTMADNMAWLLKKIHANGTPDYPEREEWQPMHFIR